MTTQSRLSAAVGIAALASMLACASDRRQSTAQTQSEHRGGAVTFAEPEQGSPAPGESPELSLAEGDPAPWRITAVVIDVRLADACGIDSAKTNFDYDSAELNADAEATIAALADCFINGPLLDREMVVIGHADPRGPDDYNRELGMSRAEAVAQALTREGLANTRIDVESHGEAHAHADPDEWPDDRRVDVRVAE
jgi:outer membrane protein OmpA-like peptidoglycan-associated protein